MLFAFRLEIARPLLTACLQESVIMDLAFYLTQKQRFSRWFHPVFFFSSL